MKEYSIDIGPGSVARDNLNAVAGITYSELDGMIERGYIDYEMVNGQPHTTMEMFWTLCLTKIKERQANKEDEMSDYLYAIKRSLTSIANSLEIIADAVQVAAPFPEYDKTVTDDIDIDEED